MDFIVLAFRAHYAMARADKRGPQAVLHTKQAKHVLIERFKQSAANTPAGRRFYAFLRSCAHTDSKLHPALAVLIQTNTGELSYLRDVANFCTQKTVEDRRVELKKKYGRNRFVMMWMDTYDTLYNTGAEQARKTTTKVVSLGDMYTRFAGPGHRGTRLLAVA